MYVCVYIYIYIYIYMQQWNQLLMLGDIVSHDTFVWQVMQAIEFRIFQDAKNA